MTHPQSLTISVIMPVRNDLRVARALDSVLSQELPDDVDLDIVIVDDSDDDTPALLAAYAAAHPERIRISPTPGGARGIYPARNHGLALARGGVIGNLNADDHYTDSRVLSDIAEIFRADPSLDLAHGRLTMVDGAGNPFFHSEPMPDEWRFTWQIPPDMCSFWNRQVFDRFGGYREDLRLCSDYAFFVRAYRSGLTRRELGRVTGIFAAGGASDRNTLDVHFRICQERLRSWWGYGFGTPAMFRAEWHPFCVLVRYCRGRLLRPVWRLIRHIVRRAT